KDPASYNKHIPMYINGNLVWGEEPDGTKAVPGADLENQGTVTPPITTEPTTTPTTPPTTEEPTEVKYGDVNCDGETDIADVVLLKCHLINAGGYSITKQGMVNGDVQNVGNGINVQDAIAIQKATLKMGTLPVE
ncbi:MAG: dockerin type I repeat-containing protein, partial [Ruminococcus sp.]|nr:dockerin type I repeat-containing protein [Ruminococcus sp.]